MTKRVSTLEVRRRIGVLLDRVALRHDEFVIERKGKPLAALVSLERLEQMRRYARLHALDFLDQQRGGPLSEEQATTVVGQARHWARKRSRRAAPRSA